MLSVRSDEDQGATWIADSRLKKTSSRGSNTKVEKKLSIERTAFTRKLSRRAAEREREARKEKQDISSGSEDHGASHHCGAMPYFPTWARYGAPPEPPALSGGTRLFVREAQLPQPSFRICKMCDCCEPAEGFRACRGCFHWGCNDCVMTCGACVEINAELCDQGWCSQCDDAHQCGVSKLNFMRCECCHMFSYDEDSTACVLCARYVTCCGYHCVTCGNDDTFCADCIDLHLERHHTDLVVVNVQCARVGPCGPLQCVKRSAGRHRPHHGPCSCGEDGIRVTAYLLSGEEVARVTCSPTTTVAKCLTYIAELMEDRFARLDQPEVQFVLQNIVLGEWWTCTSMLKDWAPRDPSSSTGGRSQSMARSS